MDNCKNEISVVIPVYNGASTLSELVERLRASLSQISEFYEVILVDDRGPQSVWPLIREFGKDDHRIKGIRLSRNFGQHPAITAGLSVARAKWYVVMDCDLQDSPEDIVALYRHAVDNNYDSVVATRKTHDTDGSRKIGSFLFNKTIQWLADIPASQKIGNFRIFNQNMAEAFRQYPEQMRFFHALMSNVGFEVASLEVARAARAEGMSSYTLNKLIRLAFDAIIANSVKPLYYLLVGGLLISILSGVFGIFTILNKLFGGIEVDGWASLMTVTFFLGGTIIFTICLVGVYVGQVFFEVKRRPIFIVQESVNVRSQS